MLRLKVEYVSEGFIREVLDEFNWDFFRGEENEHAKGTFEEGSYTNYAYLQAEKDMFPPHSFPARLDWSYKQDYIELECDEYSTKPERFLALYRLYKESNESVRNSDMEVYAEAYIDTVPAVREHLTASQQ